MKATDKNKTINNLPALHLGHVEAVVLLEPQLHHVIADQLDRDRGRLPEER
jgi:hypothetical protein